MSELEKHLIPKEESDLLATEYDKTNYAAINAKRSPEKPDSKYYTYDLEILQEYINMIREGMEKRGIKNKGIRITLGKYPEDQFDPRLNPLYKGYQTIFFSAEDMDAAKENSEKVSNPEDLPGLNFGQLYPPY
ncbi:MULTISPECIES: hypothetical protein [Chryseobacterium]|uniref:Uncharacterized protein n=1 Tax=Chryseobacterium salivictor TaxID=2547600 RepID=A0A4V1ALC0_9FLAO|nr:MULTISPECIES: hypothetical protein [Chryseobacterium]MDQ0475805.1 hypothetical protein [Chryseobacterium sp. MDT2-18]QBO59234.1 hypothetical protein NBC122_02430 [Chryseobacterium salivictor]